MQESEVVGLRSLAYRYFSELLDYPYDDDIEVLDEKMEELRHLLDLLSEVMKCHAAAEKVERAVEEYLLELKRLGRDYFQAEYVATFELGSPKPLCPPFEREYLSPGEVSKGSFVEVTGGGRPSDELEKEMGVLASITEFYEECGVRIRNATPDHLVVELEFLHYLVSKEFEALEDGNQEKALEFRKRQLEFIETHLSRWLGRFSKCLKERGTLKVYYILVDALSSFMEMDAEFLRKCLF
ncbi:MAG TPA: hypothetical protein ENF57_00730 [Candidatus Korarchaeota archaeon]|nr:hypothetical protein [Candidatus Korarchaeota archaeon]